MPFSSFMCDKPLMLLISIRYPGDANLNYIMGIRLWPPESILASSPYFWSNEIASAIVPGDSYWKD